MKCKKEKNLYENVDIKEKKITLKEENSEIMIENTHIKVKIKMKNLKKNLYA